MKIQTLFLIFTLSICTALSWGQNWDLSETMTATLDVDGLLTVSTTAASEAMPDFEWNASPWVDIRGDIRSVVIGENVTSIGNLSFFNCWNLISVSLPNTLTSIGERTFSWSVKLQSISLPNSVTSIGQSAFESCSGFTSIILPDRLATIGMSAFYNCSRLIEITIPASVSNIGGGAFMDCDELEAINVDEQNAEYTSIEGVLYNNNETTLICYPKGKTDDSFTIPNTVERIDVNAFFRSQLKTVTLSDNLDIIGPGAFVESSLESVLFSGAVRGIDQIAFQSTNLASIRIPKSVEWIGAGAFSHCNSLWEVTVEWTTPLSVSVNDTLFYDVDLSTAVLRVPEGTKALYEAAEVWQDFGSIEEYAPAGIITTEVQTLKAHVSNGVVYITGLQPGTPVSIYTMSGQLVYKGITKTEKDHIPLNTSGVYVIEAGKQRVKIIRN